jgi:hypothetical protein
MANRTTPDLSCWLARREGYSPALKDRPQPATQVQIAFSFSALASPQQPHLEADFETGGAMTLKPLMTAMAVVIGISGMAAIGSAPAQAQNAVEAEMLGFHQLCDRGDRKACIRFGILIGQNQQRHADWRRAHADWFWWER